MVPGGADAEGTTALPSGTAGRAAGLLGQRTLEGATIAATIVLDQLTKAAVRQAIDLHDTVAIVPGFLNLTHVRNTGAAFGFLNTADFPFKAVVIAVIATAALVGIAIYGSHLPLEDRLARTGLALILGGAVGNLIDRTAIGYVLDFVDVYWRTYHFWAFNVADSAITVGAAFLIADMWRAGRHVSKTV